MKLVGNRTKPEICLTEIRFLLTTFWGMPCTPGLKSANISKPKADIEKQTTARKTTVKLCQYVKFGCNRKETEIGLNENLFVFVEICVHTMLSTVIKLRISEKLRHLLKKKNR